MSEHISAQRKIQSSTKRGQTPQATSTPEVNAPLPPGYGHDFRKIAIFPQLEVNAPGDRFEREADQTASQVVARLALANQPAVQREDEEENLQRKPQPHRDPADGGFEVQSAHQAMTLLSRAVGIVQRDGPTDAGVPPIAGVPEAPAPTAEQPPPVPESVTRLQSIHGLWMLDMLQRLKAMPTDQVQEMLAKVDSLQGQINVPRTRVALEAALGLVFTAPSIGFLDAHSAPGDANNDQVGEIRDFMKPDAFDRSASALIARVTTQVQTSVRQAVQQAQDATANPTSAARNAQLAMPALPQDAQSGLDKLQILSPLAARQLQAVINAQRSLASTDAKALSDTQRLSDLNPGQDWCGGFAAASYVPLELARQLKGVFWSTDKLFDFFNYGHSYDPYRTISADGQEYDVQAYHTQRGSMRHWTTGDQIRAGGNLDLRPGDVVLQDNRGSTGAEGIHVTGADHIQLVQSYDPSTQTLYTVDGNGGGYQVDQRSDAARKADHSLDTDTKRQGIEAATGYRLRPGGGGGVVGLGSYNLANEPTEAETQQARSQGRKSVRIVGIGRPSAVDFETHNYSTKPPAPPKPAPAANAPGGK